MAATPLAMDVVESIPRTFLRRLWALQGWLRVDVSRETSASGHPFRVDVSVQPSMNMHLLVTF